MGKADNKFNFKLLFPVSVSVFFIFTFLFYGPLGLYLENAEELWFTLKDTLLIVSVVSILAFFLIMLFAVLLPSKAMVFITKLLFGVALALYVQGTYINTNYGGVLNGTEIDWEKYTAYGIWTLIVWIICIFLPFGIGLIKKLNAERIIMITALFLTAVQIPALVIERINYTPSSQGEFVVSTEGEFEFAEKNNVIIIAMDTLDEAYFQDFIEDHPDYISNLNGFVHYDNTLSSGAYTIIGVPAMLTGVPFKHESTYTEYINKIWSEENPIERLHDVGYDVRVYTEATFFSPSSQNYISNFMPSSGKVGSYLILAEKLYKLTSFKFMQHYLKQFFWMDTAEFSEAQTSEDRYKTNDGVFYSNFQKLGVTVNKQYKKAFRYYLLNGAHSPYRLTSEGVYGSETTSLKEQVEGVLKIVSEILNELKEKGLYDSSTIILTCDHGQKHVGEHSCFLYKAPNASDAYVTSHAPVSVFDLPVLLNNISGKSSDTGEYGTDFLQLKEDEIRERHFFQNAKGTSRIQIDEYMTVSDAGDYDSLKLVSSYDDVNGADTPYILGTELVFNRDATGNRYAFEGFGNNTGYRSLLYGPYANLIIPILNVPDGGELSVYFGLHSSSKKGEEYLVKANGLEVSSGTVDKELVSKGLRFNVPVEVLRDNNTLTIELIFPGISQDEMEFKVTSRTETISLTSLVINAIE